MYQNQNARLSDPGEGIIRLPEYKWSTELGLFLSYLVTHSLQTIHEVHLI